MSRNATTRITGFPLAAAIAAYCFGTDSRNLPWT